MHARSLARIRPQSMVAKSANVFWEWLRNSAVAVSAITAGVVLLAYLSSIAPDLTWANHSGDGGELITASFTLGVPHPPGYPIYVILGKAFSTLPVGTIAFRYNLLSAISLATAAGLVTLTIIRSSRRTFTAKNLLPQVAGLVAGLTVAFAPLVWSQAIVAEVYALNFAFLAAFLLALTFHRGRAHFLAGLFLGMSCTSHATSLLMAPVGLAAVPRNSWSKLALGFLIGLLPLLLLPVLADSGSPLIWGRPDTLPGWWWLISADLYRPNVFGLAPADLWLRLRQWAPGLATNIMLLAIPAALLYAKRRNRPETIMRPPGLDAVRPIATGSSQLTLLLAALVYTIFAIFYSGFDAQVLLLPAVLALGVLLGLQILRSGRSGRLGLLALLLPAGLLILNLQSQNLSQEYSVRLTAERLLRELPPEALIVTPGDQSFAALSYFLEVEGQRSDLALVDANLYQFDWYRLRLSNDIPTLQEWRRDDLRAFISQTLTSRPVCIVSLLPASENHCLNRSR